MRSASFIKTFLFSVIFAATALNISAQTSVKPPRQEKLINGLKVLMWSDPKANDVKMVVRVHSGAAFDPQGKEGVMNLLANDLFPNEGSYTLFTEDLNGSLKVATTYDFIEVRASSDTDNMVRMIETLATAFSNPTIDKETTKTIREASLANIAKLSADPSYTADNAVAARLFGTFPYGRPVLGTQQSVSKIDFADLIDAKRRFLTADNATVAIYGNVDQTLAYRAIRRLFGAWIKSDQRVPSTFRQPDKPDSAVLFSASPDPSAGAIRVATRGTSRNAKDLAAAEIFARIMQDRLKHRLPAAHAGNVFVRNEPHFLPGQFTIGMSATSAEFGEANGKVEASDLILKALADPITESEYAAARTSFTADIASRPTVDLWLDADTFGISAETDRLAAGSVTISDVKTFADKIKAQPYAVIALTTASNKN